MPELPHFASPFAFTAGTADVVEQDSDEDVQACVYNIAVCPIGFRTDEPAFGIPDPTFSPVPINTTALAAAIARWEPRADLSVTEHATALNEAIRTITIDAGTQTS